MKNLGFYLFLTNFCQMEKPELFFEGIAIFNYQKLRKEKKKMLNLVFHTMYLIYSQIWLNFPRDDHHFLCIILWMITI